MCYKAKAAFCSEIHTKHIKAMWVPRRILEFYTWSYVKLPLDFKRLISDIHNTTILSYIWKMQVWKKQWRILKLGYIFACWDITQYIWLCSLVLHGTQHREGACMLSNPSFKWGSVQNNVEDFYAHLIKSCTNLGIWLPRLLNFIWWCLIFSK
jgi:hypothetical protein